VPEVSEPVSKCYADGGHIHEAEREAWTERLLRLLCSEAPSDHSGDHFHSAHVSSDQRSPQNRHRCSQLQNASCPDLNFTLMLRTTVTISLA